MHSSRCCTAARLELLHLRSGLETGRHKHCCVTAGQTGSLSPEVHSQIIHELDIHNLASAMNAMHLVDADS